MSKWVSVNDSTPRPWQVVMIYPRPTDYCLEGVFDGAGWTYGEYEAYNGHVQIKCNVTHWMDLPDPPSHSNTEVSATIQEVSNSAFCEAADECYRLAKGHPQGSDYRGALEFAEDNIRNFIKY